MKSKMISLYMLLLLKIYENQYFYNYNNNSVDSIEKLTRCLTMEVLISQKIIDVISSNSKINPFNYHIDIIIDDGYDVFFKISSYNEEISEYINSILYDNEKLIMKYVNKLRERFINGGLL